MKAALWSLLVLTIAGASSPNAAVGAVDLSASLDDSGASVVPGGTATYVVSYANLGDVDVTGVVLTDSLPAYTSFNAGASGAGWSCTSGHAPANCTLNIGALAAGSGTFTTNFAVTVDSPANAGVLQITNYAFIVDDHSHGSDPTPENDEEAESTPIDAAPDLSLSVSDGDATSQAESPVAYILSFSNSGNRGASNVLLSATVPLHATFTGSSDWACTPNNSAGSTCTTTSLATIEANTTGTKWFVVTVDWPTDNFGQISTTASISDDGTNGADPTPSDNVSGDSTPVGVLDFYTVTPCRLLDTRAPDGEFGGPTLFPGTPRQFSGMGSGCGVPVGAVAISVNVTATNATAQGFLRLFKGSITPPPMSTVNFGPHQTRANSAIVALNLGGAFALQVGGPLGSEVDAIVDINGYFLKHY